MRALIEKRLARGPEQADPLSRLLADGVSGWWTDEGDWIGSAEQTFRDLSVSATGIRNHYNNAWARVLYQGQRSTSARRVVNITRTGGVGIQRYGTSLWSGDVSTTFEALTAQLQMGLNAGLSQHRRLSTTFKHSVVPASGPRTMAIW